MATDPTPISVGHTFDQLAEWRKTIRAFCLPHRDSVLHFESNRSFKIVVEHEPDLDKDRLRHLTNSATCIESLLRCEGDDESQREKAVALAQRHAGFAIQAKNEDWQAEDTAPIYSRCRGLPLVLRYAADSGQHRLAEHVARVFNQLATPTREAIGETVPEGVPERPETTYPPNAFHTYWALEILSLYEARWPDKWPQDWSKKLAEEHRQRLLTWAEGAAAHQIVLHKAKSPDLDSDQLAWALSVVVGFGMKSPNSEPRRQQSIVRVGLDCLFGTQEPSGTWKRYRPLFNFRYSGNAYCYIFETFDILVGVVARSRNPAVIDALAPHAPSLMRLLEYANGTRVPLKQGTHGYGWCSGNTTNRSLPEGWATASVYAFAESLRVMFGAWTRSAAIRDFRLKQFAKPEGDDEAVLWKKLRSRGENWRVDGRSSVAEKLATSFVNPVASARDSQDPDSSPITDDDARSAILFGPPGASKTTLVETVAQILGWDFLEVHSSDFLADGMQQVHRTADRLFARLEHLDRCVILFDEIDELVRERGEKPGDAFGRFLTTAMLPKLAELWKRRRTLFFLATNHIESFDAAITRSERFDSLIFVSPPSFEAKTKELLAKLQEQKPGAWTGAFKQKEIVDAFYEDNEKAQPTDSLDIKHRLAQFALVRWDQIPELAKYLAESAPSAIDGDMLKSALARMQDNRLAKAQPYIEFKRDEGYDRRDFRKQPVWRVRDVPDGFAVSPPLFQSNRRTWIRTNHDFRTALEGPDYRLTRDDNLVGAVRLEATALGKAGTPTPPVAAPPESAAGMPEPKP